MGIPRQRPAGAKPRVHALDVLSILFRCLIVTSGLALGVFVAVLRVATASEWPRERAARFDAVVVLGCRVNPDGQASHALWRRATTAAALYHAGYAERIVTTGGVGDFGESEASVAAEILALEGVPRDRILIEDESTSTEENARFARARFGGDRVLIVTDGFHTLRARKTFERFYSEVEAVGTNAPWARTRRLGAAREILALGGYAVLGRMKLGTRAIRNRSLVADVHDARRPRAHRPVPVPSPFSLSGPFGSAGFLVSCRFNEARRFPERSNGPCGPYPRPRTHG